ncbi:MAG TPA: RagB/SusD family nutrient uptake outer membrane protein, partial [Verrucomicrobiae bacterium]|nr:RagB/SusD family nutrient uptake outer membrane protein [Verrucomicrobiae bacterium]
MKKIFLFILPVIAAASCTKVLNTQPTDFLAPEYYYNDSTQVDNALTAVYDALQKGNLFTGGDGLLTIYNVTDEMFWGSSGTGPKIYNYTAGDNNDYNMWSACYTGISRANLLLANIGRADMDSVKRRQAEGEAKFLRAFFYFILVENWGDVPLISQPVSGVNEVNVPRTSQAEVYDFIVKEMTEAEGMVAPITAYDHAGRVTQSAVQGVLARVCLYMAGWPLNDVSKYQDALTWAQKVIGSGYHELNKSYGQVFINLVQDLYDTKESIWEVEYWTTGVGDAYKEYAPSLGVTLGVTQTDISKGYVAGSYRVHPRLYNLFEADPYITDTVDHSPDLRRDWNIAPFKYTGNKAPDKTYYKPTQIYDRQPNKFDRIYELTTNKFQSNTGTNLPLLRYSDVLLMAAEADNEINGPTTYAIDLVNQVRRRGYGKLLDGEGVKTITLDAGGSGYTSAPDVVITGGGGSGATATAVLTGDVVTAIRLTSHGVNYTSTPDVVITG